MSCVASHQPSSVLASLPEMIGVDFSLHTVVRLHLGLVCPTGEKKTSPSPTSSIATVESDEAGKGPHSRWSLFLSVLCDHCATQSG